MVWLDPNNNNYIGVILGLYKANGKEHGSYYSIIGYILMVWCVLRPWSALPVARCFCTEPQIPSLTSRTLGLFCYYYES